MSAIFVFLQLGHQAINCTNGTINWKQIYGEESFKLKAPIYPSDYDAVKKAKTVDVDKFTKLAQEWRTAHADAAMPVPGVVAVKKAPAENGAPASATPAAAEAPLPEGWAATKDAQGRTYFWHKTTKKVQWDRPTAATPIS
ncbi:hypothetical protein CVIRNUC_006646 [Coccomyxa viridis]|uniref:WW domain-containing protein n=1 Tax=Coccomyxa viridis TaxID=1274662 RepID=A0AAV1IB50_9CHLO|nr:hypothetical protein CVIRNUC_006646 [Coccomyxa viridis]